MEGACDDCRACHLSSAGVHPDLQLIEPPPDKKLIGIDQIREVNERVSLTASGGTRKVVSVAPAEAMTRPAANTLLKTLEEPPGDTVFILISDRSDLLPATIRSRCQALSFPCPSEAAALSWLEGRIDTEVPASELLAFAHGAPLRAVELARRSDTRSEVLRDLQSLLAGEAHAVNIAEGWVEYGIDEVSWWLSAIAQQALRAHFAPGLPSADKTTHSLSQETSVPAWFHLLDCCLAARGALARQINLNERLALESLALACREAA